LIGTLSLTLIGFQPAAAGHLARVPTTGWKPRLAGKMPAPLLLADISRLRPWVKLKKEKTGQATARIVCSNHET
jgi:hypothetical protein